jgi:hypothetical protein
MCVPALISRLPPVIVISGILRKGGLKASTRRADPRAGFSRKDAQNMDKRPSASSAVTESFRARGGRICDTAQGFCASRRT